MGAWARMRRMVEELSGRSGATFAGLLGEQVAATLEGARLVRDTAIAGPTTRTTDVRARMGEVEHRGDQARATVIAQLSQTLVAPIDREDLFRLSRSVDDVLDNLRDFTRELDLFEVDDHRFAVPLVDAIVDGIEALHTAVDELARTAESVTRAALTVRKSANSVRRLYQEGLAELFREPVDGDALKRRELLRRLDVVGLRLGEAADALADGAVKRQQ